VDTPEIRTRNLKEKVFGKSVRDKLRVKILNSLVKVRCEDFDKYGRPLAIIYKNRGIVKEQHQFTKTEFDSLFDENGNFAPPKIEEELSEEKV
jgi:hypothetical protein